ncbi:MAG: hypothetical protein ABIO93_00365 [Dyadobacter sp.]
MLAVMLLMVAGARSWSEHSTQGIYNSKAKEINKDLSKKAATSRSNEAEQAKVSTFSLDAVITPAISFDFSHYFYFLPQPVWYFPSSQLVVRIAFKESFFLFSYFHRIFGRFIVTNAP